MIDKLDLEVPHRMPFNSAFHKAWFGPDNEKIFGKKSGGLYLVSADLRRVGIPAKLSVGHKFHEKLGPKLEIIGAGDLTFSAWADVHDQVFQGEAWDDAILRADLTADVGGVPVSDFGRAMWCKYKHTNQQEYGEAETTRYSRFAAQTLYYGRKPRQVRFYDKTRHRAQVLLPALHRQQRRAGAELSTFAEAYGYDEKIIVTRAERQMGARETSEAWGVGVLGEIHRLATCDPFEKLRFLHDATGGPRLEELDGMRRMCVEVLLRMIEDEGADQARAWARGMFDKANSFRKFWRENEHLIIRVNPKISRENLTMQYRASIEKQLAA